jgi:hypothetical protein
MPNSAKGANAKSFSGVRGIRESSAKFLNSEKYSLFIGKEVLPAQEALRFGLDHTLRPQQLGKQPGHRFHLTCAVGLRLTAIGVLARLAG